MVVSDYRGGEKVVVTASLDKTIAAWRLSPNVDEDGEVAASNVGGEGDATGAVPPLRPFYCEVQKIAAPGGPVFSIACARSQFDQAPRPRTPDGRLTASLIYCGTAGKDVVSWQPLMPAFNPNFRLDGHSGWVRAVATYDRYLFSAGGSFLRQFDCTYTKPKEVSTTEVSSDIVAIMAGGGNVYAAGSDGSLWAWGIDRNSGHLSLIAAVEGAHKGGRIVGLHRHRGCVYSASSDGVVRQWSGVDLAPGASLTSAHGTDTKLHCFAIAGNGVMYTGGEDCLIRAWNPADLTPVPGFEPLGVHTSPVRSLVAGKGELLVSGDAEGYVHFFSAPITPGIGAGSALDPAAAAASEYDVVSAATMFVMGAAAACTATSNIFSSDSSSDSDTAGAPAGAAAASPPSAESASVAATAAVVMAVVASELLVTPQQPPVTVVAVTTGGDEESEDEDDLGAADRAARSIVTLGAEYDAELEATMDSSDEEDEGVRAASASSAPAAEAGEEVGGVDSAHALPLGFAHSVPAASAFDGSGAEDEAAPEEASAASAEAADIAVAVSSMAAALAAMVAEHGAFVPLADAKPRQLDAGGAPGGGSTT